VGLQSPALVPLLIGIICGVAVISSAAWRILRRRLDDASRRTNEGQIEIARLSERAAKSTELQQAVELGAKEIHRLGEELAEQRTKSGISESVAQERLQQIDRLGAELSNAKTRGQQLADEQASLRINLATVTTTLESERSQNAEKLAILSDAEKKFTSTFESLANRILEEKSKRFADQNQSNLDQLLLPLKTKIEDFQRKVEDVYDKEGRDRTALAMQVKQLMELNHQLSQEANNLTQALKGSGQAQGSWGERILERVLESSGLRQGHEYELRESYKREDGSRAQPDVVIHLLEGKDLVVDSKVSLTAYREYATADNDEDRAAAIALHLDSVRRHVKELSSKNYQELYDLKSIDFVIMFVPIEPAFMLAVAQDSELCEGAWKKNVLLVSPSTFLFAVRTVAYLWRQEQSNRNVREIARRGGELYDKLVGFVQDLAGVGNRLRQAMESYEGARNKLVEGRGNLIRQAEMLKELGVKPSKTLPRDLVDSALTEQPLVLPRLVASADGEDLGASEEPDAVHALADEDIPF
jgi:DNA recombination protein RmuC